MLVIHISEATQQYIADNFNEGVVPELGKNDPDSDGQDTYYLVKEDNTPNEIVTCEYYLDHLNDANDHHVLYPEL